MLHTASWLLAAATGAPSFLRGTGYADCTISHREYHSNHGGSVELTFKRECALGWELEFDCDLQRQGLADILSRLMKTKPEAHTVRIFSYTGRKIGEIKRGLLGPKYHCGGSGR